MLTEQDYSIYSDLHKEAYGHRPHGQWDAIRSMTEAEFRSDMDYMSKAASARWEAEERGEALMRKELAKRLHTMCSTQGISMADAIRWFADAEGCVHEGHVDLEHWLWCEGCGCGWQSRLIAHWMAEELGQRSWHNG